jgi:alanyl-tRNA synthetase
VDLVAAGAEILGGRGGGKPELAQAGGSDSAKIDAAISAIKQSIQQSANKEQVAK